MQTEIKNEIVLRIPKNVYNKNIQRLIDVVEYKKIIKKSKGTQNDLNKLLEDIKNERTLLVKPFLDRIKKKSGK